MYPSNQDIHDFHVQLMNAVKHGLSCIICRNSHLCPKKGSIMNGTIDIWWIEECGQLLLILAHLLKRNKEWENCSLRLFSICGISDDVMEIEEEIGMYLSLLRIKVYFLECYSNSIA